MLAWKAGKRGTLAESIKLKRRREAVGFDDQRQRRGVGRRDSFYLSCVRKGF